MFLLFLQLTCASCCCDVRHQRFGTHRSSSLLDFVVVVAVHSAQYLFLFCIHQVPSSFCGRTYYIIPFFLGGFAYTANQVAFLLREHESAKTQAGLTAGDLQQRLVEAQGLLDRERDTSAERKVLELRPAINKSVSKKLRLFFSNVFEKFGIRNTVRYEEIGQCENEAHFPGLSWVQFPRSIYSGKPRYLVLGIGSA